MRKALKWLGIGLAGLVVLAVIAAGVLYLMGGSRLARRYDITVAPITVSADSTSIARGRHLIDAITMCTGCHGDDLAGKVLIDQPIMATVYASNLTAGRGGVGATYSDVDYARAIRHGVNPAGRGLMIMHSDAYQHLSQADLGATIAFLRSAPPVDKELPATRVGPLGRILVALGLIDGESMPLIPAEVIDHDAPLAEPPPPAATADYGRYLVSIAMCRICHGGDLRGAPPIEEGAPPGPNIAALAAPGAWSEDLFITTLRTGVTPYGKALDAEIMPWNRYGRMTDEELGAIWRYLGATTTVGDGRGR
jgi:cytochrome c553